MNGLINSDYLPYSKERSPYPDIYECSYIQNKKWAGDMQEEILRDEIRHFKVNQKYYPKEYQYVHSKWVCQSNIGRWLELERECYSQHAILSSRTYARTIVVIQKAIITIEKDETRDPYQEFVPSGHLVELVEKHMVHPDRKTIEMLEGLKEMEPISEIKELDIASIITEEVEGLFTRLARSALNPEEPIQISDNSRFTSEICSEIIEVLAIDVYDPLPVLKCLYTELIDFASIPRERHWGKIVAENSELKLILKQNALAYPDFDNIDEDRWIVTQ